MLLLRRTLVQLLFCQQIFQTYKRVTQQAMPQRTTAGIKIQTPPLTFGLLTRVRSFVKFAQTILIHTSKYFYAQLY